MGWGGGHIIRHIIAVWDASCVPWAGVAERLQNPAGPSMQPDSKTAKIKAEVLAAGGTWRDVARLPESGTRPSTCIQGGAGQGLLPA